MTTFGQNLKKARSAAGYTQQQVADRFSVTRGAVAQWESGAIYPDASRLGDIAEFLDCSLDVLFRGKVEQTEDAADHIPAMATFWMVAGIGQRGPAYRHWSQEAAKAEALRLAKVNPNVIFVVLEATSAFRSEEPRIIEISVDPDADDGIPF
ncbi:XRE family transcriptional regulator [Neorhizobium lilium]|uniref:XRE family transcriptional regulator n=1 Tax=Neorhizobium lilium TaxID=2503024 RepID=A0A444LGZ3_9HYPH|nr:helix-turn-helix transcriptional regulator [Neorhizobium lilium]RWX78293.1 XRE family transcriptional regulator [Neorhizobium lilium]